MCFMYTICMIVLKKQGMYPISIERAKEFLLPRHYSGRMPSSLCYKFGWYIDYELVAVCTFGRPSAPNVGTSICGKEHAHKVWELNRLCRVEHLKEPLSKFVGWCLRELKKENLIIISYSDSQMNHHGYIYQACNFIYTGTNEKRTYPYVPGNVHSRHISSPKTKLRSEYYPKHRYIYFAMSRKEKKKMTKLLQYGDYIYPKGENSNYTLGETMRSKVI